ncbi:MAG TPA: hypothetical protein VJA21_16245 [Verrucomicrobiae bacterium]
MTAKKIPLVIAAVGLLFLGALVGDKWGRRNVICYSGVSGWSVAFDERDPLYGIHLAEDVAVLRMLRAGMLTQTVERLELFLDLGIEQAKCRLPVLSKEGKTRELAGVLTQVATYRQQYPRKLAEGTGFYWTAERQEELDAFLMPYRKQTNQPVSR